MHSFQSTFDDLGVAGSPSLHSSRTNPNSHSIFNNRHPNSQSLPSPNTTATKMNKFKLPFGSRRGKHQSANSIPTSSQDSSTSGLESNSTAQQQLLAASSSQTSLPSQGESKPPQSPRIGKLTMSLATHVFQKRSFHTSSTGIHRSNKGVQSSTTIDSSAPSSPRNPPHSIPSSPTDVPPPLPPKEAIHARSKSHSQRVEAPELGHQRMRSDVSSTPGDIQSSAVNVSTEEDSKIKDGWRKSDLSTTSGHTIRPAAKHNAVSSSDSPLPTREQSPVPPPSGTSSDAHPHPTRSSSPLGVEREATPLSFSSTSTHATSVSAAESIRSTLSSPASSASIPTTTSLSHQDGPSPTAANPQSPVRSNKRGLNFGMGNMLRNMASWKSSSNVSLNEMISSEASSNESSKELQVQPAHKARIQDTTSTSTHAPPSSFPQTSVWPSSDPDQDTEHPQSVSSKTKLRQTATSFTNASAGLALGLGKRAVEKVKASGGSLNSKVWNSWGHSGQSQSSSEALPSNQTSRKAPKRTPNAPSGSWSEQSVGSGSEASDPNETPPKKLSPYLGVLLRQPIQDGGMVFGRDLTSCVRDTRAVSPVEQMGVDPPLEHRSIPALVLRCAMHLRKWGLQEEGLFRVSGRASHIAVLRKEFDSGADWDMSECSPAELDPHAVASIFKAFFRELPETILTRQFASLFDAAMAAEKDANAMNSSHQPGSSATGSGSLKMSGLPSGPRVRPTATKSTSVAPGRTLSSPTAAPTPSERLIRTLAALLAQLPPENRDIVRTITELLRATALRSKFTKMPLNNLLLIFCPGLNMNPPLLRILCENENVWKPPQTDVVLDIRSKPPVSADAEGSDAVSVGSNSSGLGLRTANTGRRVPVPALLPIATLNLEGLGDLQGQSTSGQLSGARKSRSHSTSSLVVSPSLVEEDQVAYAIPGVRTRASTLTGDVVPRDVPLKDFPFVPRTSASSSTAALVELPPVTPEELEVSDETADEEEGAFSQSRRRTLKAANPRDSIVGQLYLTQNESEPFQPKEEGVSDVLFPSASTSSSSFFQTNVAGSPVIPANHEESLQMLRQLKAISESELKATSPKDLGPIPPLRHVLSLNLLHSSGSSKPLIDTPSSIRSLPSPKSPMSGHGRSPSLLGWKLRRRSTDLAVLARFMSEADEQDNTRSSASPPPKLTLPFETTPSSPINLRLERRKSAELSGLPMVHSRYSYLFGRSKSSPMLTRAVSDGPEGSRSGVRVQDQNILGAPLLQHSLSMPPTLILNTESASDSDWAQSVLQAANASND